MADLLQKVFQVHVRGYYENESGNKVFYKGKIYGDLLPNTGTSARYQLETINNVSKEFSSLADMNTENAFNSDPWFLYKTYTSYNKMRDELKSLIAIYGTDNVRVSIYVPVDYEVLPNQ